MDRNGMGAVYDAIPGTLFCLFLFTVSFTVWQCCYKKEDEHLGHYLVILLTCLFWLVLCFLYLLFAVGSILNFGEDSDSSTDFRFPFMQETTIQETTSSGGFVTVQVPHTGITNALGQPGAVITQDIYYD